MTITRDLLWQYCINSDHIVTQLLNDLNIDKKDEESDCDETSSDNKDCDCEDCADNENH